MPQICEDKHIDVAALKSEAENKKLWQQLSLDEKKSHIQSTIDQYLLRPTQLQLTFKQPDFCSLNV